VVRAFIAGNDDQRFVTTEITRERSFPLRKLNVWQ
jgi:hypothetical protein